MDEEPGVGYDPAMSPPRKRAADIVIFIGMAVNAVVIVLILYFYVF